MHPMFVKLFLENSADDGLAEEEDRRRAANRARRARSRSRSAQNEWIVPIRASSSWPSARPLIGETEIQAT